MPRSAQPLSGFAAAVLNALTSNICVINRDGIIVAVNQAWLKFSEENSGGARRSDIGTNYLEICRTATGHGSEGAYEFARGLEMVLARTTEKFELEYPCDSPTEPRWFLARATPLEHEQGGVVISHANVTDSKRLVFDLAKLAATDPLTGVPNRRHFVDVAAAELERTKRFGTSTSILMIDLDHFKSVNDTYGHATGDEALRSAAKACKSAVRKADLLARMGGEEFAALLPGTDMTSALAVAEKLRRAVASIAVCVEQNTCWLTTSIGVSQVSPDDKTIEEALSRADGALYRAKRSGRNCVFAEDTE